MTKGILGVPRRQVFVFGRYAEDLPSDDSDDSDFTDPGSDEESTNTASSSKG